MRVTSAAYQQIANDIEERSRVHGAGWWQTLRRILIALALLAFAVGWALIFFGIMRQLWPRSCSTRPAPRCCRS